ncbi:hypothetical protein ACIA8O_13850 [Kitasatospora sp. NPDC051853]|uniref:hypothetical protein n=1 Tax=Kitasatospora sp. NPDC051853 TaxID=3364058 RepID=UPI0037B3CB28
MSEFILTRPRHAPQVTEHVLLQELWQACGPTDRVEHIRVHVSRAGAKGVVFSLAADPSRARTECQELCLRALSQSPHLRAWSALPARAL